jgi:hypothetical protein
MPVFIEPDRTQYSPNFEAISCAGLEQLTGADMVISSIPIPPTINLTLHIANRSLFVQIKIGYDICSFDQLHSAIARIQECQIPKQQAILLPIGEYRSDDNGLLKVKGQKAFGHTTYETLGTIYDMWELRGGTVEALPPKSINDLQKWIDRKIASLEKIKEGKRDIYPPSPIFQVDDIWQSVEEIRDWRRFFVSGLEGFGSKKANAIFDYVSENYSGQPLWGNKSRKEFRGLLGIPEGWNLPELAYHLAFYQGWQSFGNEFARLVNKNRKPQEVHKKLMKERENMMTDFERQIPF